MGYFFFPKFSHTPTKTLLGSFRCLLMTSTIQYNNNKCLSAYKIIRSMFFTGSVLSISLQKELTTTTKVYSRALTDQD